MDVQFKNSKMKKIFEDHKLLTREYGAQQSKEIIQRINEFISAENLYDISKIPQARLHSLAGNLNSLWSVDIKHPYRMLIELLNGDPSDLKSITSIQIDGVRNYHRGHS
ncbi:MAG: type II toxin-antitoxin system RelE/ParE family toxin [Candidatus Omnitrophica bacterium]|nr:type II toxin-antitoxin system RelE/ParE family toxin [Candidatus Omnitrophota bacterium]